ncbi:MAG: flagellin, partial [Selenomonas sp.]
MQIMNNSATMAALGEFKKNDTTLGKELKKVASGMKLNSAGDDASAYAISERMRTNIRALSQATDNVKTGQSLLRVASAAIDHQVGLLQQVAVRTMQASDDTYTDKDRATLNKEISQLLDESDDIAYETTYNGRHLLDQTEMGKVEGAYTFLSNNTYTANAPSKIAV